MRMNAKKIICLFLVAGLIITLVACGGNKNNEKKETTEIIETIETNVTETEKLKKIITYTINHLDAGFHIDIDDKMYYLDRNREKIKNAWLVSDKNKYFCDENGVVATGLTTIEGKNYYFDDKIGFLFTEAFNLNGYHYEVSNDGEIKEKISLTEYKKKQRKLYKTEDIISEDEDFEDTDLYSRIGYYKYLTDEEKNEVDEWINDFYKTNIENSITKDEDGWMFKREMAIVKWFVDNTEYDYDGLAEYGNKESKIGNEIHYDRESHLIYTPYDIVKNNKAVCDGFASIFALLCEKCEIPVVKVHKPGIHAWNMVKLDDDEWYHIDVTWNICCGMYDTYTNFNDEECVNTHYDEWYPNDIKANGQKYNATYVQQYFSELREEEIQYELEQKRIENEKKNEKIKEKISTDKNYNVVEKLADENIDYKTFKGILDPVKVYVSIDVINRGVDSSYCLTKEEFINNSMTINLRTYVNKDLQKGNIQIIEQNDLSKDERGYICYDANFSTSSKGIGLVKNKIKNFFENNKVGDEYIDNLTLLTSKAVKNEHKEYKNMCEESSLIDVLKCFLDNVSYEKRCVLYIIDDNDSKESYYGEEYTDVDIYNQSITLLNYVLAKAETSAKKHIKETYYAGDNLYCDYCFLIDKDNKLHCYYKEVIANDKITTIRQPMLDIYIGSDYEKSTTFSESNIDEQKIIPDLKVRAVSGISSSYRIKYKKNEQGFFYDNNLKVQPGGLKEKLETIYFHGNLYNDVPENTESTSMSSGNEAKECFNLLKECYNACVKNYEDEAVVFDGSDTILNVLKNTADDLLLYSNFEKNPQDKFDDIRNKNDTSFGITNLFSFSSSLVYYYYKESGGKVGNEWTSHMKYKASDDCYFDTTKNIWVKKENRGNIAPKGIFDWEDKEGYYIFTVGSVVLGGENISFYYLNDAKTGELIRKRTVEEVEKLNSDKSLDLMSNE